MTFLKRIVNIENVVQEKTFGWWQEEEWLGRELEGKAEDPGCVVSWMPREETESGRMKHDKYRWYCY